MATTSLIRAASIRNSAAKMVSRAWSTHYGGTNWGLFVDIVPNHMAVGSGNRWWMDVLAAGPESRYAKFFDIDWESAGQNLRDKVLLADPGPPLWRSARCRRDYPAGVTKPANSSSAISITFFRFAPTMGDDRRCITHDIRSRPPRPAARRLHQLLERNIIGSPGGVRPTT